QYWPAEYLVDVDGKVRHVHFGEGEYDKTEAAIRGLLQRAGKTLPATGSATIDPGITSDAQTQTVELYAARREYVVTPLGYADNQPTLFTDPGPDGAGHRRANA